MSSGIASGSVNIIPASQTFNFAYAGVPGNNVEVPVVTVAAGKTLYITGLNFTNVNTSSADTYACLVDDVDVLVMVINAETGETQTSYPLFAVEAGSTIEIECRTANSLNCNMWGFYL